MKEQEFISILISSGVMRTVPPEVLDTPVEDLDLDSMDLEILRTVLEKHLKRRIDDAFWQSASNFRQLIEGV